MLLFFHSQMQSSSDMCTLDICVPAEGGNSKFKSSGVGRTYENYNDNAFSAPKSCHEGPNFVESMHALL